MEENIKEYTSRIPSEAWTEVEEIHSACFMGDNVKTRMSKQVFDTNNNEKTRAKRGGSQGSFHNDFTYKTT